MNSYIAFKRLLREAGIKYEIWENKPGSKRLVVVEFHMLSILFTEDVYVKVHNCHLFNGGKNRKDYPLWTFQPRNKYETMFPAPTLTHLIAKLLRYNYITLPEAERLTGISVSEKPKKTRRRNSVKKQ